jgi:hypothetical protein
MESSMKTYSITGTVHKEQLTEVKLLKKLRARTVRYFKVSEFKPIYANVN